MVGNDIIKPALQAESNGSAQNYNYQVMISPLYTT
jgi:hypothetical protein